MALALKLLGSLGGAEVEVIPVEGTASGGSGTSQVLATVEIPEGETWLVACEGDMNPRYTTSSSSPDLMLGTIKTNRYNTQNHMSVAGVHTQPVEVKIKRNTATGSDSFVGTVYTVKIDD